MLTKNQVSYLNYLKDNPQGFGKCEGFLAHGNDRCAIGMCAEAMRIDLSLLVKLNDDNYHEDIEDDKIEALISKVYDETCSWLDLSDEDFNLIWKVNDGSFGHEQLTFLQIAEHLSEKWNEG